MTTQKEFIEYLLSKVKDFKDGVFIPNEIELKISDIENFNPIIANELSQIEELSCSGFLFLAESNAINATNIIGAKKRKIKHGPIPDMSYTSNKNIFNSS